MLGKIKKEVEVMGKINYNPKDIYIYAKSKSNLKNGIDPLESSSVVFTNNSEEMANLPNMVKSLALLILSIKL